MAKRLTEEQVRERLMRTHIGKQGEREVLLCPDWFPRTLSLVGVRWVEDHFEELAA